MSLISKGSKPTQRCFTACERSINGEDCECTGFKSGTNILISSDYKTDVELNQDYDLSLMNLNKYNSEDEDNDWDGGIKYFDLNDEW